MENLSHEFLLPPEGSGLANTRMPTPAMDTPVNKQARIEDAEDHEDQPSSHIHYSEAYLCSAGQPICKEKTEFETFCNHENATGRQPWEPFSSKKEWGLATLLMRNVNQRATEQFLNLPIVSI